MRQQLDGSRSQADSMARVRMVLGAISDDDWLSLQSEFVPAQMAHTYGKEVPLAGELGRALADDIPV